MVRSLLGLTDGEDDVYMFNEQYILKPPSHSRRTEFPWHQDKEGLDWYESYDMAHTLTQRTGCSIV